MKAEYKKLIDRAVSKRKENKRLVKAMEKLPPKEVHNRFQKAHEQAFSRIDCLQCANCCKSVGPRFKASEIKRLAKYKGMDELSFKAKYLRVDEDGDYVLQQTPCLFLQSDNKCEVYDIRPEACRDYPHTDRVDIKKHLSVTLRNSKHCPAVAEMFTTLNK